MPKAGKSKKKQTDGVKYDISTVLPCPDCLKMIHVGTAGPANLVNHKPACKGRPKGKIQKISDMFPSVPKPRAPQVLVPSTVTVAGSSHGTHRPARSLDLHRRLGKRK
ncbi:hypothetical protein B0H13DRAFT_1870677 [Mycena leptocephala]|nr:hypothetical protein B0H13DRAFT_1870677 [Mycena leptocephala]